MTRLATATMQAVFAAAAALFATVGTALLALGASTLLWLGAFVVAIVTGAAALASVVAQAAQPSKGSAAAGYDHFLGRARGLPGLSGSDDLFVGRTAALAAVVSWLVATDDFPRLCVVTGAPGSGKSAIIGRLVAESDRRLRRNLRNLNPGVTIGTFDAVVHARKLLLGEVQEALAVQLKVRSEDPEELAGAIGRQSPLIVIDALDEADGDDSHRIAQRLIRPMVDAGARVVVGLRKRSRDDLTFALGADRYTVDIDEESYFAVAEIRKYVTLLLTHSDTDAARRFRTDRALTADVADAVARRAGHSFLIAQFIARDLARAPSPPDVTDRAWLTRLPSTVAEALETYISRLDTAADRWRARSLLTALALAEGSGFPYDARADVWSVCASALGAASYGPRDIEWLLSSRVADLIDGPHGDPGTFRIFHDELVTYLRPTGPRLARFQANLALALGDSFSGKWAMAPKYVVDHLATHAVDGGTLDVLTADPLYILAAEPVRLLRAMSVSGSTWAQAVHAVYRLAFPRLIGASSRVRASYLELAARQARVVTVADKIASAAPERPWVTHWAAWQPPSAHHVLGRHDAPVRRVVTSNLRSGRPVAISTAGDTAIVWDLETGLARGEPLAAPGGLIATGNIDGTAIALTSDAASRLLAWDLDEGRPDGRAFGHHSGAIRALAVTELDRIPIAVVADETGLRVWNLRTRTEHARPIPVGHRVAEMAAKACGARSLVAFIADQYRLHVVDLSDGTWLVRAAKLFADDTLVSSVALAVVDGVAVALCGGDNGAFAMWDIVRNELRGEPMWQGGTDPDWDGDGVLAIAVGEIDGRPVAVSGGDTEWKVRVWDLQTCSEERTALSGHDADVHAVALAVVHGRPVVLSGSLDASIRVWDIASPAGDIEPFDGHASTVRHAATGTTWGQEIVVSSDQHGFQVRDLSTGRLAWQPVASDTKLFGFRLAVLDKSPIAVSIAKYSGLKVVDLRSGRTLGELPKHRSAALLTESVQGRPVLLTGGEALRLWDLRTMEQLWAADQRTCAGMRPITALASLVMQGANVALSGDDQGCLTPWDLATGQPYGWSIAGHDGPVDSVTSTGASGDPIVVSTAPDGIRVWDVDAKLALGQLPPLRGLHRAPELAVIAGGDQPLLVVASGDDDGTCTVFDLRTVAMIVSFAVGSRVLKLAGDGRGGILVATRAGLARIGVGSM